MPDPLTDLNGWANGLLVGLNDSGLAWLPSVVLTLIVLGATLALPPKKLPPGKRPKPWLVSNWLVPVALLLAQLVMIWPAAGAWFADSAQSQGASGFVNAIDSAPPAELADKLAAAQAFNQEVAQHPDSLVLRPVEGDPVLLDYQHELEIPGTDSIAWLTVPQAQIDLPIYRGTSDEVLDRGVGHVYGSSLPVGGPSTHSVLTGHSGLVTATLFTHLNQVTQGAQFQIRVANRVLTYEVRRIQVVLAADADSLEVIEPGKDLVTLVTCTPLGVNTHRLLVTGERIPTPVDAAGAPQTLFGSGGPGFPWWAAQFVATVVGGTVVIWLVAVFRRRRAKAAA